MTRNRQRALVIGLIGLGLIVAVFFGMRALHAFRVFRERRPPPLPAAAESLPIETDVDLIRDWMTIPYIARTYNVHPRALFEALDIPPQGNEEKSLGELNNEYFPEAPGIVIEMIKAAVRANQAVPTALPPLPPLTPIPANP